MKTTVQKWGNSLAVRIPKVFADEVALECDSEVDLTVHDGMLTLTPVRPKKYTLREMVDRITPENRHEEIPTGPSVGNEQW